MTTGANHSSRVLAVLSCLLLVSTAANAGHKLQKEERKTVNVSGQTGLIVKSAQGKVIIVGGADETKVKILAQKWVQARSAEKAAEIMDLLKFDVEERAGEILIIARPPKGLDKEKSVWALVRGEKQDAYIDFTIEIPRKFNVKAATTSGDVRITNIGGVTAVSATSGNVVLRDIGDNSVIHLTSGSVEARDIGGNLEIAASSGNAEVRRVKGLFSMQATSGSVEAFEIGGDASIELFNGNLILEGCLGNLNFSTASGDARIVDVLGSINASSSSGKLDVVIVPVGEKTFVLNTSSGDIDVYYLTPTEYGFLLDVNTCSGAIRGDLPIKVDKITRQTLKGIVGTGRARVIVETASGDVFIAERKEKKK